MGRQPGNSNRMSRKAGLVFLVGRKLSAAIGSGMGAHGAIWADQNGCFGFFWSVLIVLLHLHICLLCVNS